MKSLIVIFILFIFFMSLNSKLHMLISMHRHGARSPKKFFNSSWFPLGKMQLTPIGKIQMQNLGHFYRTKYFESLKMNENTRTYPLYISSPVKRCLDSAKNLYLGLYPDETIKDYNEIPIEFKRSLLLHELKSEKNEGFPIFVQDKASDFLFHGFKTNICGKCGQLMKSKIKSLEAIEKLEELRVTFFPILSQSLKKTMDIELDPNEMTYSHMKGIYDVIVSCKTHGIPVDFRLNQGQFTRLTKERRNFIHNYKLGEPELIKLATSRFFDILKQLLSEKRKNLMSERHNHDFSLVKQIENATSSHPFSAITPNINTNMVLFSGHDTMMILILNAMITKEEKERLADLIDLKYGSHIDFELIEEENELFVRVYLNEKLVHLEKCKGGMNGKCRLQEFDRFLKERIEEDWENECLK